MQPAQRNRAAERPENLHAVGTPSRRLTSTNRWRHAGKRIGGVALADQMRGMPLPIVHKSSTRGLVQRARYVPVRLSQCAARLPGREHEPETCAKATAPGWRSPWDLSFA